MHVHHLLRDPYLIAYVLFAYLCTVASYPPKGWRGWVTAICWLILLLLIAVHWLA